MNLDDRGKVKVGICIAAFTVLFYLGIQHMDVVIKVSQFLVGVVSPFIIGICFAFVLNLLMKFFEQRIFRNPKKNYSPRIQRARRPICIAITLFLFLGLLTALFSFLIPQMTASLKTLGKNLPSYITNLENLANEFLKDFGVSADIVETVSNFLYQFSDSIVNSVTTALPKIFETATSIASGFFNGIFGFIISIYMLANKEKLMCNIKRTGYAFLPRKAADYLCHVYHISNNRFNGFVSGQLTEAVILGVLCFIVMMIAGAFAPSSAWHEYALLISAIVGMTNVVPIVGPIIGAIPGALIFLMIDPKQAFLFVLIIIALQQIESNFIYPRVVGTSVGLPGLWVLFGVLIGGDLFGLPGVLLGVPALSVIYVLIREAVAKRLKERQLKV